MRKNTASQVVAFQMVSSTDGSNVTAGSPTVYYTIDGGTQGTGSGTSAHEGNGQWSYAPTQAETNGDHVAFTMVLTGAVSQCVNVYPVAYDPTSVSLGLNDPTAAAIADAVWDEATAGHVAGGSFGKMVISIYDSQIAADGQINDLSAITTSFVTNLTEASDDHYNDAVITFVTGNLSGQSRVISDYNGTTKTVTLDEALTEAPANGDEFLIKTGHVHIGISGADIETALNNVLTTNTIVAGETIAESIRRVGAVTSGLLAGARTGTEQVSDWEGNVCGVFTVDTNGNRTLVEWS